MSVLANSILVNKTGEKAVKTAEITETIEITRAVSTNKNGKGGEYLIIDLVQVPFIW